MLIDTVVKGLPMPLVFLRAVENSEGVISREVVDGQQRLRTLLGFVNPKLLTDYRGGSGNLNSGISGIAA